jgi:two-component system response regulator PrrA
MSRPTSGVVLVVSTHTPCNDDAVYAQLCAAGLSARVTDEVEDALATATAAVPAVLVVDAACSPERAGCAAVLAIRAGGFAGPILVVGRKPGARAAAAALDAGADDYVRLPCDSTELVARIRALARRGAAFPDTVPDRQLDGLELDLRHGIVRGHGAEVGLTRRETDLFEYLARNAGLPVSRAQLAAHVWNVVATDANTNIVDVYVSYLRRKLAAVGRPSLIRSVRGVGYQLGADRCAERVSAVSDLRAARSAPSAPTASPRRPAHRQPARASSGD